MSISDQREPIFIAAPPEEGWPQQFFILGATASPDATISHPDEPSHVALRKSLSRLRYWKHRIEVASPDWKHREKAFAAGGLDLSQALRLAVQFGQNLIFQVHCDALCAIPCSGGEPQKLGRFSQRLLLPADEPKYRIYVIRLDDAVLQVKRFREANPKHQPGKPCFYVGMTGLTPEERFANHKNGHKDCSLVRHYGLHLAQSMYGHIPPLSRVEAQRMESSHAADLRSQGYAVWQH